MDGLKIEAAWGSDRETNHCRISMWRRRTTGIQLTRNQAAATKIGNRGKEQRLWRFGDLTRRSFSFWRSWRITTIVPGSKQNKQRYETEVLEPSLAFIREFASRLKKISPYFVASDRRVGGSLMRVYRDTRFGKDKTPYKTNVGIQFRHEFGKDVHAPGFYVHLAPGECFLAMGAWRPDKEALTLIRQAILDHPDRWKRARNDSKFRCPISTGWGQPEDSAARLSRRSPVARGLETHGLRRPAGGQPARRAPPEIHRHRSRVLRRRPAVHAIPVRRPARPVLIWSAHATCHRFLSFFLYFFLP